MPPEGYEHGYRSWGGMPYYPMNYPDGSWNGKRSKEAVQSELNAAVEAENYELAAKLRDELNDME